MAKTIKRKGFGQVELNQDIAIVEAAFVDMVPADTESTGEILEQGQFVRQKIADNNVGRVLVKPGDADAYGPFMMVYNEEYFYDERDRHHKDFAMKAEDFFNGEIVPRCFQPIRLSKLTTNCFVAHNTGKNVVMDDENAIELKLGDEIGVNEDGFFCAYGDACDGSPKWLVIKEYDMPDGQDAVKLQCIED